MGDLKVFIILRAFETEEVSVAVLLRQVLYSDETNIFTSGL